MSVPPDPSQPTGRLPPATAARRDDVVIHDREELVWREDVRSRLQSLTAALTLAIAVAFVALGVSLWALLGEDRRDRDAGAGRVRALEQASPAP